jgi:hypothetical protein
MTFKVKKMNFSFGFNIFCAWVAFDFDLTNTGITTLKVVLKILPHDEEEGWMGISSIVNGVTWYIKHLLHTLTGFK